MFGLLRPCFQRLDEGSRSFYNMHYCGCCRALIAELGLSAAFFINYEITFLSLVISAVQGSSAGAGERPVREFRCPVMPLRKKKALDFGERARSYLASVTLLLVESKLRDDGEDEGGVMPGLLLRLISGKARRAAASLKTFDFPLLLFQEYHHRQKHCEQDENSTAEQLADPTASLVAEIFRCSASVCGAPDRGESLYRLGYSVGAFVYLHDAIEDYAADIRRKRFNALSRARAGGDERGFFAARDGHQATMRALLGIIADEQMMRIFEAIIAPRERSARRMESCGAEEQRGRKKFRPFSLRFAERGACICDGCDIAVCCSDCCTNSACSAACDSCACCGTFNCDESCCGNRGGTRGDSAAAPPAGPDGDSPGEPGGGAPPL
ncbi:MAG: DUF5685 family protein [Candidatus Eremiobacteraeota bacterium]|nr:DUF5685 family protein [Candidatus Eremiobacteraeota bacterium]